MGQWGLETSAGDSVHDYLQHIQVDTSKFRQKDVQPLLDYTWKDGQATDRDKLGVVMHLLVHELTVPIDKLNQVMEIANNELRPNQLATWTEKAERKAMVVIEMNDINFAIENGGKGRARHEQGLLEKMADIIDKETIAKEEAMSGEITIKHPSKEKTIKLPCYGIVVVLTDLELHALTPNRYGGGSINSDLKEEPDIEGLMSSSVIAKEIKECNIYNASVDALESIILGHACAGMDITILAYIEGIETAVQALANTDYSVEPLG